MVSFEPEEEAGTVFLRLRKAFRKKGLTSWTLAPYLSNGARKMGATLIPTVPGAEASVLEHLPADVVLDSRSVILVGERAAQSSGALSAVLSLSQQTGARLAWIPRRAGDRGAIEAGCLPNLLPGGRPVSDAAARIDTATTWSVDAVPSLEGRDADEMLISAANRELAALIVAGVDPSDFIDPQVAIDGLEAAGFVVSIEARASLVTERADVVFPVSLIEERAGSFMNWEGRHRRFEVVIEKNNTMTDLRVLSALADGMGSDLGLRNAARARAELLELGRWEGQRPAAPRIEPARVGRPGHGTAVLATWRLALDASRALDGEGPLLATARTPVARMSARTAADGGVDGRVIIGNDRGSLTLPVEIVPTMTDGVVWVPNRAPGLAVSEHLAASAGDIVTIGPAAQPDAEPVDRTGAGS
jgi:NADH-quinone oxidoreductase subunit G